jgi:membrane peptidoglycan carboxypeptidase
MSVRCTKESLLSEYLTSVYVGRGANGVEQAAAGYFDRPPLTLSPAECFFIAERIALPNALRPARVRNILRRVAVRDIMGEHIVHLAPTYDRVFGKRAGATIDTIVSEVLGDNRTG